MKTHFVQFYADDASLVEQVSEFMGVGLEAGSGGLVIATPAHRLDIECALQERQGGSDIIKSGSLYATLDATEVQSHFMVDGWPDRRRFLDYFAPIIDNASDGGKRPVRVFGEIVAVLVEADRYDAALRLEELWNELKSTHPFTLFCAYPMHLVGKMEYSGLARICAQHGCATLPARLSEPLAMASAG